MRVILNFRMLLVWNVCCLPCNWTANRLDSRKTNRHLLLLILVSTLCLPKNLSFLTLILCEIGQVLLIVTECATRYVLYKCSELSWELLIRHVISCYSKMYYVTSDLLFFFYVSYRYRVWSARSGWLCASFLYKRHLKVSRILTALLTWSNCQTHWSLPHILSQPKFPLTSFESSMRQGNLNESVSIFNHHKHMSSSCPLFCPERITLKNKVWTDFKMRLSFLAGPCLLYDFQDISAEFGRCA